MNCPLCFILSVYNKYHCITGIKRSLQGNHLLLFTTVLLYVFIIIVNVVRETFIYSGLFSFYLVLWEGPRTEYSIRFVATIDESLGRHSTVASTAGRPAPCHALCGHTIAESRQGHADHWPSGDQTALYHAMDTTVCGRGMRRRRCGFHRGSSAGRQRRLQGIIQGTVSLLRANNHGMYCCLARYPQSNSDHSMCFCL